MSFSSIAIQQREKENSSLKSFLTYCFIGSLLIHTGVLTLAAFSKLVARLPQKQEDEPIQVTIVDTPPQAVKLPENLKQEPQTNPSVLKATSPDEKTLPTMKDLPQQSVVAEKQPELKQSVVPEKQVQLQTPPVQNAEKQPEKITPETQKTEQRTEVKPVDTKPHQEISDNKPVKNSTSTVVTKSPVNDTPANNVKPQSSSQSTSVIPPGGGGSTPGGGIGTAPGSTIETGPSVIKSSDTGVGTKSILLGNGTVNNVGNSTGTSPGNSTNVNPGSGKGNGVGNGKGNGVSNGVGNGKGNGIGNNTIATGLIPRKTEAPPSDNSGDGRAACRECNSVYPENARDRGVEGKVGVSVDTDANGNVTKVHLTSSSGNRDLDEETLRQARNWKLKSSAAGREGVSISTEYALEGSNRYHELQERKKQREEEKKRDTASNSNSNDENPLRKRRSTLGTITDVPAESTKRESQRTTSVNKEPDVLRPRRQNVDSDTPNKSQPETRKRRQNVDSTTPTPSKKTPASKKHDTEKTTPTKTSTLRDSLINYRDQPKSTDK